MKKILLATTILAMTAVSAMAADLGNGFSLGADINAEYNVTAGGDVALTGTPMLGYTTGAFEFTVGTDIDLADIEFVGLDFEATYDVNENFELYAETSTDSNLKFGDLVVGGTLSF
jgi:opacity protein-like surface antigen